VTIALCDTNVWIALALTDHVHHRAARAWLDSVDEPGSIRFCRATQQSLLRLLTYAPVLSPYHRPPLSNDEAWSVYDALVADERIVLQVEEPMGVDEWWATFSARPTASPKLWMDAYLAAFAHAGGYELVTTDTAFQQFGGLSVRLIGGARASG